MNEMDMISTSYKDC